MAFAIPARVLAVVLLIAEDTLLQTVAPRAIVLTSQYAHHRVGIGTTADAGVRRNQEGGPLQLPRVPALL